MAQVEVEGAQQIGEADRQADPASRRERGRARAAQDLQRGERDPAAGRLEVLLEGGKRRRRRLLELALAGNDRGREPGPHGRVIAQRRMEGLGDRMGGRPPGRSAASASRHHCRRISPAIGWLTTWRTLPISWSKA